jgi:acyl-CoA synthetase (AMP-forming)/AMP-acid ligase II
VGVTAKGSPESIAQLLQEPTLGSAFLRAAELWPDRPSLRQFGSGDELSLAGWAQRATSVAGGLIVLGVRPGDRVALLLSTRVEFHLVDMGALLVGAVPFSLYVSSLVEQLRPCIENALPRVLITESALVERAREVRAVCPVIEHLVVLEAPAAGELSLAELEQSAPAGFDPRGLVASVSGDDLCSLLYTSGTSGPPKGVRYLHRALMKTMSAIHERFPVGDDGATVSYLPMAHIAERLFSHYAAFVFGYSVVSLGEMPRLADALCEVRPTRFFGVPRTWEKLLAAIEHHLDTDRVPASRRLGEEGGGFKQVMQGFDYSRALIGLQGLAVARQSLSETWPAVTERTSFNKPLVAHQGVSFPLAGAETFVHACRLLCLQTLWLKDERRPHTAEAAMCKWWAPKLAFEVVHQCLLLHGHGGYSTELPFEQRLRDVLGMQIGDGTAQIMKLIIARQKAGRDAVSH